MQNSGQDKEEGVDKRRGHRNNQALGFPAHQSRCHVALYKYPERPLDEERLPEQAAFVNQTYNYRTNKYSSASCISEKEQQVPLPDDNPKNITMQELRTFDEGTCKSNGYDWVARPGLCAPDEN